MARVSTYLNFPGTTFQAFEFYRSVFGTEYPGQPQRMRDVSNVEGFPILDETEADMIMHIELPILGGHVLMGTDVLPSMGREFRVGNNVSINLEPDSRVEADRLHAALSDGGSQSTGMIEQFWGAYWGSCTDRFGTSWMINCVAPA
jgi:PhnB protein